MTLDLRQASFRLCNRHVLRRRLRGEVPIDEGFGLATVLPHRLVPDFVLPCAHLARCVFRWGVLDRNRDSFPASDGRFDFRGGHFGLTDGTDLLFSFWGLKVIAWPLLRVE